MSFFYQLPVTSYSLLMINWLHTFQPTSILIEFNFISIHWYGLIITLAALAGILTARSLFKKYQIDLDHLYNLSFYLIIFGFIGARVYHVLNELTFYLQNPGQVLAVQNGGLALHGGLIAGAITIYFYLKKHKNIIPSYPLPVTRYLFFLDIFAPAMILGQAIGRWGNYFNQELYGLPTSLPWGIPIALENRVAGFVDFQFFQPTFLYESLASLAIFLILIYIHKRRLKKVTSYQLPVTSYGSIFSIYLILYSIVRLLTELIRIDQTPVVLGVRLPIIISSLLIVVGLCLLVYNKKYRDTSNSSDA